MQVLDLFSGFRNQTETALVVISPDRRLADWFDSMLFLKDGILTEQPPIEIEQSA